MKRPRGPTPHGYTWDNERGWVDADDVVRPDASRNERRVQQRNKSAEQLERHRRKYELYDSHGRLWARQHPEEARRHAAWEVEEEERRRLATERYEEMLRPARQRLHGWLARRVSYAGPFTARQVEYCCPTMWICRRYGSCCDDYAKCTMVVGNCLSDHIDISMDVYEVTFPDAPPGSIHEKVKSDAPVQYSASLVAKLLGEALPRPVKAVVDKRYELEREQLEEEVAMEDCV